MRADEFRELLEYGAWADAKLMAVAEQLSPEQFVQPLAGLHASVRDVLVHMASAAAAWLGRCGGPPLGAPLRPADYPDAASVAALHAQVAAQFEAFLAGMSDEETDLSVEFAYWNGQHDTVPRGELLQHVANHGTHHRGQLALMLQWLGQDPGNFDLILYRAERRHAGG